MSEAAAYTCLNCHEGGHVEAECPAIPHLDIVFTAKPGPGNECVFVEVERDGRSVRVGTWTDHPDGYVSLRITPEDFE